VYCVCCDKNIGDSEIDEDLHKFRQNFESIKVEWEQTKHLIVDDEGKFTYKKLVMGLRDGSFKNIVVLTGAGISVSAGIPDFRSPGTGVYANLDKYNLPFPEAIFTLEFFIQQPEAFYTFCKEFDLDIYKPTPSHYFLVLLEKLGILKMVMTQNIDDLEEKAGVNVKERLL